MRQPLDKALRKKLEDTVIKGRDIVEVAVHEALQRLGVADSQVPSYLNEAERKLRNKLRAHARQLGDSLENGNQQVERLTNEMAYEHWHRMLFACYLEQNNLLMYDQYTAVTIEECAELAEEEDNCKDGWELAGRLAQKMLPQIFRADSPVFEVKLSINHVNELERLISKLDPATYQAQDSLGWCYQFWQTKKKQQVNDSGVKIGAQELSAVTQLFTEPYMVSFLLDNALGAWWANKRLTQDNLIRANNEQELRELASIPGVSLEYLRFIKNEDSNAWVPAAGGFEQWPDHLSELKTLDPCCGSGHFLVAKFLMLVPMRMQLEGLTEKEAVDAVIRENIHGLELDQRCVELAAFALALEAWRYPNTGGYRVLPELQLACSGMSITEAQKEWKELAKGDEELQGAIKWMQDTFKEAPTLGSLIDPTKALSDGNPPPWELLQQAMTNKVDASIESKTVAQGLALSAKVLSERYDYVMTNPPYLKGGNHDEKLKKFCEINYGLSKKDLATVFIQRCLSLLNCNGSTSLVLPQNWLFLKSYAHLRKDLLQKFGWNFVIKLGAGAFETISGEVVQAMLLSLNAKEAKTIFDGSFSLDASAARSTETKSSTLSKHEISSFLPSKQLDNPDCILSTDGVNFSNSIRKYAKSAAGLSSFDRPRFFQYFHEQLRPIQGWVLSQSTVESTRHFGGCEFSFLWESGEGQLKTMMNEKKRLENYTSAIWRAGTQFWGSKGVLVSLMGSIPSSLYLGGPYDQNTALLVPLENSSLQELWAYCRTKEFSNNVRLIDPSLKVTTATLESVPFIKDITDSLPLPLPYSDDPTQWIFHGHPCASVVWGEETKVTVIDKLREDYSVLQVAVARLLGYQWPAELDLEMELAPEMREVMKKNADFAGLVDDDGIVCIPAVRGEKSATKRLEAILYKAYGDEWTSSVEANLLKSVKAKDLDSWLRDKFFDQHSKLFQHRPFIWQIWDGLKDGFSALVNYHQLDYKGLERLIYTYLDDWISTQKRDLADAKDGADIRLIAAENLKVQLEAILQGEKGLDIFVRWKPLSEQSIGWNPDLNDGVRLNIRPFMLAKDVGKKGAGVLRGKPNIHWKKDRGTDVASAPWFDLGLQYAGKQGDRINDHHLTLVEKRKAREEINE